MGGLQNIVEKGAWSCDNQVIEAGFWASGGSFGLRLAQIDDLSRNLYMPPP